MSWQIVSLASAAPQPWKNGGGSTRELLAWPRPGDWRIRLSVAEVAKAGPFSVFEGVHRWFAVLEGEGVELTLDGKTHRLDRRSAAFAFDGAAAVGCELVGGATSDFNLMTRGPQGVMRRVVDKWQARAAAQSFVAAYASSGAARLRMDGEAVSLAPGTLAWQVMPRGADIELEGGDALWMEIEA